MATKTRTPIDLPGAEGYRFRLALKAKGSAALVHLEQQVVGPIWVVRDSRAHSEFSRLKEFEQAGWAERARADLLQDWFPMEIAAARR